MYGLGTDAIYTLSLHDALPICGRLYPAVGTGRPRPPLGGLTGSSVLLFRPGHRNSSRTDQFSALSASRLKGRISSIRPSRSLVAHSGSEISTRPTATRSNS